MGNTCGRRASTSAEVERLEVAVAEAQRARSEAEAKLARLGQVRRLPLLFAHCSSAGSSKHGQSSAAHKTLYTARRSQLNGDGGATVGSVHLCSLWTGLRGGEAAGAHGRGFG